MNALWRNLSGLSLSVPAADVPRGAARMELAIARHGVRTCIERQFVSYPFHFTRPFALDAAIPQLLTVYQQSCSGGLYRGEQLACRYELGRDAAAHITSQSATVVHDCRGQMVRQLTEVSLESGAFLALIPDPLVLFPGALCGLMLEARMAEDAILIVADTFARHDPFRGSNASIPEHVFQAYESEIVIRDALGQLLVRDCSSVTGAAISGRYSPAGKWSNVSSFILAGKRDRLPTYDALKALAVGKQYVAGVSELPNRTGWGVRCLASDAATARTFAEELFSLSVVAAFGKPPAPRRK